jgi:hypothetical protein
MNVNIKTLLHKKYNNILMTDNFKAIVSGATAGVVGVVLTLPIEYIKTNIQANNTFGNILKNVKNHGFKILYRGGSISILLIGPQFAIKYYLFDNFNKLFDNCNNCVWYKPVSGFCAGLIEGAVIGPFVSLQIFRQLTITKNNFNYFPTIKNNVYSLMIPMAFRNAFYTGTVLGGYSIIKNQYYKNDKISFMGNIFISSCLTIPGIILCCPFDVLKTKYDSIMLQNLNKHISLYNVFKNIFKNEGIKGFYRGYFSLCTHAILRFPLSFALQIKILDILNELN